MTKLLHSIARFIDRMDDSVSLFGVALSLSLFALALGCSISVAVHGFPK